MVGIFPGVECARRRRVHSSGSSSAVSAAGKRSFCLYPSNRVRDNGPSFLGHVSNKIYQKDLDEHLSEATKIAKERLHERLREVWKPMRHSSRERQSVKDWLLIKVFGTKKTGGSLISWFVWRIGDPEECSICLKQFKPGETLVHLPCAHRFHWMCVVALLDNNAPCPYCNKLMR